MTILLTWPTVRLGCRSEVRGPTISLLTLLRGDFAGNGVFEEWSRVLSALSRPNIFCRAGLSTLCRVRSTIRWQVNLVLDYHVHKFWIFCLQIFNLLLRISLILNTGFILRFQFGLKLSDKILHLDYLAFKLLEVLIFLFLEWFNPLESFLQLGFLRTDLILAILAFLADISTDTILDLWHGHVACAYLIS